MTNKKKIIIPIAIILVLAIAGTSVYLLTKQEPTEINLNTDTLEPVEVQEYNFNTNTEYTLEDLTETETDEMGVITGVKPDGQLGSVVPDEIDYIFNGEGLEEYITSVESEQSTEETTTTEASTPTTDSNTQATTPSTTETATVGRGTVSTMTSEQLQAQEDNAQPSGNNVTFNAN